MSKSILRSVCEIVVLTLIIVSGLSWASKVHAEDKTVGWVGISNNADSEDTTGITVTGDRGGVITLTCQADKNIKATYKSPEGKYYDMWTMRNYGHDFGDKKDWLLAGSAAHTTLDVYTFLLRAEYAFVVDAFAQGSKDKFEKTIETGSASPKLKEASEAPETFVTTEIISGYVHQLAKACPAQGKEMGSM